MSTVGGTEANVGTEVGAGYRPHLDGIRAVAVYLVVVFHARADRASGGFIGVDVFFVLSGYLVTQLLMRDLRDGGSIDLKRFYSRRIRRLLPAALVVLLVTMVVFSSIGSPAEVLDARGAVRAASLYVANWFFIGQSSRYFGADIQASPVVHFWSLSVEEQFYATWPVLLAGVHLVARRAGSRRWSIIQGVVFAGMAASLGAALWVARTDLNRAYYGTDTRAYQLLAGALLALTPGVLHRLRAGSAHRRELSLVALASLVGLVLLATDLVDVSPVERGALATALTVALIISVEAGTSGLGRSVLSLPPLVYLGRISYGTYLWHWLVIIVIARVVDVSPLSTALLAVGVATGLAALSFELLERPVREARLLDRRRLAVVAFGLTASVVMGLVGTRDVLRIADDRLVTVSQGTSVGASPVPSDLDWRGAKNDTADFPDCTAAVPARCTLVNGTGPHLLLIGDSHARMYIPMLTDLARQRGLTFSAAVAPACPWQDGLQYLQNPEGCRTQQAEWYPGLVERLDPDLVILANRTFDDPASPIHILDSADGELALGSEAYLTTIEARTSTTIQRLRSGDRKVLIIEPVPVAPVGDDPLTCLSDAAYLDECRYVSHVGPTPVEQIYRRLAKADPGTFVVDLDRQVCPYLPICDPIVDGLIVKRDTSHLTTRFATTLLRPFERFLDDNGLLD